MNNIEEILQKYIDPHCFLNHNCQETVKDAMKEYAEYYAKRYLEKFLADSEPVYDITGETFLGYSTPYLETFKLPEHE
jgi:hypothetical protein